MEISGSLERLSNYLNCTFSHILLDAIAHTVI
jgi:hypothetical protein